jgi:hypothetical protein
MFFAYCLELLLLVYIAPALALFPKLILSSRTVVAIPFISIGIIAVAQCFLALTDSYSHLIVMGFSIILLLTAAARIALMFNNRSTLKVFWPDTHRALLIFSLVLGVYWAARLGSAGFDTDDEIYSWNMWAIQHYQNSATDYYYTRAPYPQLFSILISFCYKLLGSLELQLPVKTMFAIFPIALWGVIAVAPKEASIGNAKRSIVVMLLLVAAIGNYFGQGLADPLMASSLVVGIYLYMQFKTNPEHRELLVFSVICAAVALYSKQAGLIWALFSMPAIALIATWRRHLPPITLIGAGVPLAFGLVWVFVIGSGFQNNQGVINASQHGRDIFEQLLYSIKKNCADQPLVPIFIAAGIYSALRIQRHRDILILFLLPSLFAWLIYGAYSLRLGIHVIAMSALLIAVNNYPMPAFLGGGKLPSLNKPSPRRTVGYLILFALLVFSLAAFRANKNIQTYGEQFSPYTAGQNALAKYFGNDAGFVIKEIYDQPDILLWVPSNYIYGLFYGHTPMMRPNDAKISKYDDVALVEEIRVRRPNFLFDAGTAHAYGLGNALLVELAEHQCPYLFERVVGKENVFGYVVYRLHNNDVLIEKCATFLQSMTKLAP